MRVRLSVRIQMLFILTLCVFCSACVKNPVTGKRQLALMSESQEIAMGRESHPEILSEFGKVENEDLQKYCARIGNDLAKASHRPSLDWHFTIVDSPVVNAFAVPGGFIYLTRGIIEHMNNEAEFAAVLGHEIGHVTARHSVTQISQGQLFNLGLGLGSIFSSRFRQVGGLAQMGLEVLMLKYSRDHERQADQLGLQYMAKCGYDPEQMSKFFQIFEGMREESGQSIPNWLSTHPSPPERIQKTSEEGARIKRESPRRDYRINADEFLPRLDGLIYGENPREGFVEKGWFVHPDLRFQMDIPQGWDVENTRRSVIFAEPEGRALVELTLVRAEKGESPGDIARNIARQEGTRLLSGRSESIHGNRAYLGRYLVQGNSGNVEVAAAFISYGGHIYQAAGMTAESNFSRYSRSLGNTLRSFRRLTDRALLDVQPDRIKMHRARRGETLRSLAKSLDQKRVSLEDLVRINRINPDEKLHAGTWVKLVQLGRR
jgi:predicted Zn-dependent protease